MAAGGNCQTFSSSTVISYSNTGDGAPKVYQETSEMRSAPGGVSKELPSQRGRINWHPQEPGTSLVRNGLWVVYSSWGDVARALWGEVSVPVHLDPDPGDTENCPGLGQRSRADVHWASHPGQGSHPPALPKPPHRGPGGAAGLHQPG